jgi:hypothetical protein
MAGDVEIARIPVFRLEVEFMFVRAAPNPRGLPRLARASWSQARPNLSSLKNESCRHAGRNVTGEARQRNCGEGRNSQATHPKKSAKVPIKEN